MRIAQIAPLTESIPPKLYGGTERVVFWLVEELAQMGHDVTLFANGESQTSARLEAIWPRAVRFDSSVRDPIALQMLTLERVLRCINEFDILHFHLDYHPFPMFTREETPFVSTIHGRLDLPELKAVYGAYPTAPVVSISDAQRQPIPTALWARTIHHGLPKYLLTPQPVEPAYLAFLGRISPEKRVDRAIDIAERCGMPLKIAAKLDKADEDYFDENIRHLFGRPHVDYIGEIDDRRKPEFLSGAAALLMPIDWPEPFGLVMIEAMACGTPVIAYEHGSVPEIIEDGLTGFIVHDEAEAAAAVRRVGELSREVVRARFEERFTARRMATEYVDLYHELIVSNQKPVRRLAAV